MEGDHEQQMSNDAVTHGIEFIMTNNENKKKETLTEFTSVDCIFNFTEIENTSERPVKQNKV